MSGKDTHPCFEVPLDPNVKIWRYLDIVKYLSLLDSRAFFFSRSDKLGDNFEGSLPAPNLHVRPHEFKQVRLAEARVEAICSQISGMNKTFRKHVYINSWHMNEHESAAMWKIYAEGNSSIAVQTTYKILRDNLPDNVFLGVVKYIDYLKEDIPDNNMFWPFVHKRRSFEFERELRALIGDMSGFGQEYLKGGSADEEGKLVAIDLEKVIQSVYVSPTSPMWFADLIANVTEKYGLTFNVRQSELSREPIY